MKSEIIFKTYAYKHNGDFHRLWTQSKLLTETKDYYIAHTPKNTQVIESENQYWFTKEHAITYFSKKRWFNIIIMFKDEEIVYYCNLASPILEEVGSLKYIDYDLDLKYYVNSKKIKILDKKEFAVHCKKYDYPKWLQTKVNNELKTLQTWVVNEIGPFSEEFRQKWYNNNILKEINESDNNN